MRWNGCDREVASRAVSDVVSSTAPAPAEVASSTGGPWISKSSIAAATWALLLGLLLVMVGNGLNGALMGVRSEAEGFGLGITGVIMAAYFAGFMVGTRYTEYALEKVGHIRVFAGLASIASSVVLVQALSVTPLTWTAMRFLFGGAMAGIYVVVESWLNDMATNRTRGRMLSVYMLVTMGGLGIGQLMLNIEDQSGFRLFMMVSVLVSLSLVPVTLSATSSPPRLTPKPLDLTELLHRVPTGLVSMFLNGMGVGALMGMGAVYAASVDMTSQRISLFLFAPMIGAIVFQWPIGWLSDHFARRGVMIGVAAAAIVGALGALAVAERSSMAILAMFVLGGSMYPMYSLTMAYTNDWLANEEILGASATLVRVNGAGAILGPLVTAVLMATLDVRLFFWTIAGTYTLIALYVLARVLSRDPLPFDQQQRYVAFPARASAAAAALLPRFGNGNSKDLEVRE